MLQYRTVRCGARGTVQYRTRQYCTNGTVQTMAAWAFPPRTIAWHGIASRCASQFNHSNVTVDIFPILYRTAQQHLWRVSTACSSTAQYLLTALARCAFSPSRARNPSRPVCFVACYGYGKLQWSSAFNAAVTHPRPARPVCRLSQSQ